MGRLATIILLIVVTAVLIGYDIWAGLNSVPRDTISVVLLDAAWNHPIIGWLWGALGGHMFWPMELHDHVVRPIPGVFFHWRPYRIVALLVLILVTISLLVLDLTGRLPIHPVVLLAAGVPAGHFGWPLIKAKWRF